MPIRSPANRNAGSTLLHYPLLNGNGCESAPPRNAITETEEITTTWILNAVGLFLTTVGVLLVFLYLWKTPQFAEEWLTPEGKRAYAKRQRLLMVALGLLAAWFLVQYLALIL